MNTASLARLRVAEELASYYARYQNVELAIVGGSVARGVSDRHSDIDFVGNISPRSNGFFRIQNS